MTWKSDDLGSVCLETNQRDPQKEPAKEFVYVDIASVDNQTKRINRTQRILGRDAPSRARKEIRRGDILVSTVRPNLNAVALVPPELDRQIASTGFCVLRPDPKLLDGRYLFYRTTSPEFVDFLSHRVTGANYPAVSDSVVKAAPIPLPPLPIQKQIAAILEKTDSAREKRRQANQLTEQFLQSAFLDMFGDPVANPKGWEKTTIGDVASHISSGSTPLGGQSTYLPSGTQFIRSQNVRMNMLDLSDVAYISREVHEGMKRTWVKKGDVLLNITGASIGRVAFFKGADDSSNVNQHVCIIRPILSRALPAYVSFLISLPIYQSLILSRNSGATRQAFNFEQVRAFEITLPPLGAQQKFAALVQKVESLRAKQKESEKELEDLFNSLMQKAFRGELVH